MASQAWDYSVLIVVCVGSLCREAVEHYSCQTEYMVSTGIACDLHRICVLYISLIYFQNSAGSSAQIYKFKEVGLATADARRSYLHFTLSLVVGPPPAATEEQLQACPAYCSLMHVLSWRQCCQFSMGTMCLLEWPQVLKSPFECF